MAVSKKKTKYDLLVVAHPDDEAIFFAGVLLTERKRPWKVICVTDGDADARGNERGDEFKRALKILGIKNFEQWTFPDRFETRLAVGELMDRLRDFPKPERIFTHGPIGEYGHPHHQDVSYAVHMAFPENKNIFSPAYNCAADFSVALSKAEFAKRGKILAEIYVKELSRFSHLLPARNFEGYAKISIKEVRALYEFFTDEAPLDKKALKKYAWFLPFLDDYKKRAKTRMF
jgi:LmbE family N-acetylglucosaminyl deacetylase